MAEETIYNSIHTGEQIDSAVAWLLKHAQDHICGGAAPGTTIEAPTDPTYWFAGAGTYTCGGSETITIPEANIGIISYDGSEWSSNNFNVGSNQAIKNNLLILLDSLGNYCFPDGKPTFDWDDDTPVVIQYDVEKHLTNLNSDAPSKVNYGSRLVIQLTTPSNLYVIDDDTVQVTMGGVEQSGAYDPNTGKITINRVTGKVVIYATGITYVGYGDANDNRLLLLLDGKNRGNTSGQWASVVGNKTFALAGGYTEADDHVAFDGNDARGTCDFSGSMLAASTTIESVAKFTTFASPNIQQPIFTVPQDEGVVMGWYHNTSQSTITLCTAMFIFGGASTLQRSLYRYAANSFPLNSIFSFSYYGNSAMKDGVKLDAAAQSSYFTYFYNTNFNGKMWLGATPNKSDPTQFYCVKGNIYCVRLYNGVLTDDEIRQNHKVDKKRFNIQ